MNKKFISTLSFFLAMIMLSSVLFACHIPDDGSESDTSSNSSQTESSESTEESSSAPDGGDITTPPSAEGVHKDIINLSASLANGVQAYFTNASRTHYSIQNLEMTMTYARSNSSAQLVESIKNTKGNSYIQNTMDVFVRMNNGSTYYASTSTKSAEANLYRFGYYYYEGLFEFQNFIPNNYELINVSSINAERDYNNNAYYSNGISRSRDGSAPAYIIKDASDPRIVFKRDFSFSTEDHNAILITVKAIGNVTRLDVFPGLDSNSYFKNEHKISVPLIADGEYHTYCISLFGLPDFDGNINSLRIDPEGENMAVNDGIAIESISVGIADIDIDSMPSSLAINRHFHVYSNKMHHAVQFATTEKTENIAEVGMLTEIQADTVSNILIITADSTTYTSLDAGFSWDDVVAVGFDVKDAGTFGFILPADEIAGKIKVELVDGIYVIEQTRTPENGTILPSVGGVNADGNLIHAEGVTNNGNDFYIGQRIYTDESHSFDEFIKEAGFERNPLTDNRFKVMESGSDRASYVGYDAMRGIYVFNVSSPAGGFYTPYNNPQKNYRVKFTIRADVDRDIYVMAAGTSGLLECATLMDSNMMLLPVPMEVIKNFSETTGERNLFNIDDPTFSETIFCLSLAANQNLTYSIVNLYQNWGNYPLKQLSQIPYHMPYYHLSTGVTETNCIVPWYGTDSVGKGSLFALPDFRSMSAPFWKGQPQHNSCGSHYFLEYYGENGERYAVESVKNIITSYGPTYAEVVWENISDDGKIKVTYTHMEMPQTDENRTYYTMEYEFLDELTIKNFKENFQFYSATDNDKTGTYKKLGYLNSNNESVVINSNQDENEVPEYVLGDNCPYISFFMMPDWDKTSTSAEGYSNIAFLIYNSSFTIGGENADPDFLIKNPKDYVVLTLDIDGDVTFKKGDKITINAILIPWGSQQLEDGIVDEEKGNYEYTMELENGELYMDKNVRDVRENSLLDPLKATSDTDEILESPFLPKIKSKDGRTATFTLSGGENNVTVRVYGFDILTAPKVEEYVNGEWVEYVISSKNNPDRIGYYHYYDGYMVNFDEDGTYSYSFVTTMTDGAPRTFRISADTEFQGWPTEMTPQENENLLDVYADFEEISELLIANAHKFGEPKVTDTATEKYVSIFGKEGTTDAYVALHSAPDGDVVSGKYLVIKYRIPASNTESTGHFEIWSSTEFEKESANNTGSFKHYPIADGEWHVDIIDLTVSGLKSFTENEDGEYYAKFLRVDFFNIELKDAETHIDIAYVGIDADLKDICDLESEGFKTVSLYEKGKITEIDTATGEKYQKEYVSPESGYVQSEISFGAVLDFISGIPSNAPSDTSKGGIVSIYNATVTRDYSLVIQGWCAADGGIEKYVYSVDGGKTWLDVGGKFTTPTDEAIVNLAQKNAGVTFVDAEAAKKNCSFQRGATGGIFIDLGEFKDSKIDVTFAAIPAGKTNELILLYSFEDVNCSVSSIFDDSSIYNEINIPYGSVLDSINGQTINKDSSTIGGIRDIEMVIEAADDYTLTFKGWATINGGTNKYVWTADNGKTWHEFGGSVTNADDGMISYGQKLAGTTFGQPDQTKKNGCFSGNYSLIMDLSAYAGYTEPLQIYVCAIPASDSETVVILYNLENVTVK